jgi:hypothetical protein
MRYWQITGSILFVLFAPIALGALLFMPLMWLGLSSQWAVICEMIYIVVWFIIWAGPLDEGRKLVIF